MLNEALPESLREIIDSIKNGMFSLPIVLERIERQAKLTEERIEKRERESSANHEDIRSQIDLLRMEVEIIKTNTKKKVG